MPKFESRKILNAAEYQHMQFMDKKLIVALPEGRYKDVQDLAENEIEACSGAVIGLGPILEFLELLSVARRVL